MFFEFQTKDSGLGKARIKCEADSEAAEWRALFTPSEGVQTVVRWDGNTAFVESFFVEKTDGGKIVIEDRLGGGKTNYAMWTREQLCTAAAERGVPNAMNLPTHELVVALRKLDGKSDETLKPKGREVKK